MEANKKFQRKFLNAFAPGLTNEQKEKAYIGRRGGFLWHTFSYNLVSYIESDEARTEYNKIDKKGAIELFYHPELKKDTSEKKTPLAKTHLLAEQIDEEDLIEFYVIGRGFSWCYVRTHESYCGPYFCYANHKE